MCLSVSVYECICIQHAVCVFSPSRPQCCAQGFGAYTIVPLSRVADLDTSASALGAQELVPDPWTIVFLVCALVLNLVVIFTFLCIRVSARFDLGVCVLLLPANFGMRCSFLHPSFTHVCPCISVRARMCVSINVILSLSVSLCLCPPQRFCDAPRRFSVVQVSLSQLSVSVRVVEL